MQNLKAAYDFFSQFMHTLIFLKIKNIKPIIFLCFLHTFSKTQVLEIMDSKVKGLKLPNFCY